MEVYEFSREGRMKHLKEQTSGMLGAVKYLTSTGAGAKIPSGALVGRGGSKLRQGGGYNASRTTGRVKFT